MCLCRNTGSSVRFLLQSYKYIGSDGLQITATRLPQNAPNCIWNSKNFPGAIPPDPRPGLGKCKGDNPSCCTSAEDLAMILFISYHCCLHMRLSSTDIRHISDNRIIFQHDVVPAPALSWCYRTEDVSGRGVVRTSIQLFLVVGSFAAEAVSSKDLRCWSS